MARGEEITNGDSLALAFQVANNLGATFKLFFSFDYAGNGLWNESSVIALINKYQKEPSYFKRGLQPLVSTFEGPRAHETWWNIKAKTQCYFVPSWSSIGARNATQSGVVDGLFSWAAVSNFYSCHGS